MHYYCPSSVDITSIPKHQPFGKTNRQKSIPYKDCLIFVHHATFPPSTPSAKSMPANAVMLANKSPCTHPLRLASNPCLFVCTSGPSEKPSTAQTTSNRIHMRRKLPTVLLHRLLFSQSPSLRRPSTNALIPIQQPLRSNPHRRSQQG